MKWKMRISKDKIEDPQQIADYLLGKHGYKAAYSAALAGAIEAQSEDDNYRLSIWRDIKFIVSSSNSAKP